MKSVAETGFLHQKSG